MIDFTKTIAFDALGQERPEQTLIIKTDDYALIVAVSDTVRRFATTRKVLEEATLPAEETVKLVAQELNLFTESADETRIKSSRNVARRHVEAVFDGLPQTVPFHTLGDLYKYMTGKDTSRSGRPDTHVRMINRKRLPNRPQLVNILRMDVAGREYVNTKTAKAN
jgi:hypothetical protein